MSFPKCLFAGDPVSGLMEQGCETCPDRTTVMDHLER